MPLLEQEDPEQPSTSQVLIFHNHKAHSQIIVDHIRTKVKKDSKCLRSVFLNAEQTQQDRMIAFDKMRTLKLRCFVSTDLMSRGVDLPDV